MSYIDVTAAVLSHNDNILIARRPPSCHLAGYWEFPGGKIEAGETPEICLKRELYEEFNIIADIHDFITESCFDYGSKQIRLLAYHATYCSGTFTLKDHDKLEWVTLADMKNYQFAPADIPIIDHLLAAAN